MASRFASISDEELKEFTEKLENENTKKKTLYDIKVFKEYLDACDEKREIEDIAPVELQEKVLLLPLERKIHIFSPPYNIPSIYLVSQT